MDYPEGFECQKCRRQVPDAQAGTRNRNHCPYCLWSLHVAVSRDQSDRDSDCRGLMEPISIAARKDGEWMIVHRCEECGDIKTNRVLGEDDTILLMCLALKPLTSFPVPLEHVHMEAMMKYRNQP